MRVDGGVAQNDFLMQFQADILNICVERTASPEVTAWGAACAAALGSGYWKSREEIPAAQVSQAFAPSIDDKQRQFLLQTWNHAVTCARAWR